MCRGGPAPKPPAIGLSLCALTQFVLPPGVGDGGNELGMGKVKEAVKSHIRNGDVIACDVEADFAVIAGECSKGCPVGPGCPGGGTRLGAYPARSLLSKRYKDL